MKKVAIIETEKTVKETHEVDLPYFSKNIVFAYKVVSAEEMIIVEHQSVTNSCGIERRRLTSGPFEPKAVKITEQEFLQHYINVLEKIKQVAV